MTTSNLVKFKLPQCGVLICSSGNLCHVCGECIRCSGNVCEHRGLQNGSYVADGYLFKLKENGGSQ